MPTNYKLLYEQMGKMVDMYQNEIVPQMREQFEKRVEVVRCEKCSFSHYYSGAKKYACRCPLYTGGNMHSGNHFCSYGERKEDAE